jgi:hypothetical protein
MAFASSPTEAATRASSRFWTFRIFTAAAVTYPSGRQTADRSFTPPRPARAWNFIVLHLKARANASHKRRTVPYTITPGPRRMAVGWPAGRSGTESGYCTSCGLRTGPNIASRASREAARPCRHTGSLDQESDSTSERGPLECGGLPPLTQRKHDPALHRITVSRPDFRPWLRHQAKIKVRPAVAIGYKEQSPAVGVPCGIIIPGGVRRGVARV